MNRNPITATASTLLVILALLLVTSSLFAQVKFGAYYTKLSTGAEWESYSRTGKYADVVVRVSDAGGQIVFWRGNSYLPYWKTARGQWNFREIVPRSGNGTRQMPDRANVYSHVEIIKNSPSVVVIHWRYLASFTAGNPNGGVSPDNFVDELFTVYPDGRVVRKGTRTIAAWNDPLNRTTESLRLTPDGIVRTGLAEPRRSPAVKARVEGSPVKGPAVVTTVLWFKFNEGRGDSTEESETKDFLRIPGPKVYWKRGVSGTALEFDGYNTAVALPANAAPYLSGKSVSLEAWFAIGAYPWNWVPLVQQGDSAGYFLGIDSHGYPGFGVEVNGVWERLTVPNKPPYTDANHLSTFKWYDVSGTYDRNTGMMRLYVDGKEIAEKEIARGGVQTVDKDVRVGKAGVPSMPTGAIHDTGPSSFGFDGLIDEVRVYDVALTKGQVRESYRRFKPASPGRPDMEKRKFPDSGTNGKFGAYYTHLHYYETWDNLFRFGKYPDVVVGFHSLPTKFIFWHGVSFIPMMVNERNQWFTEEFNETGGHPGAPGDNEPMSDKQCYDSHVRILENNEARVVVEWRYRLASAEHHWAYYDSTTGWGDIADWCFYIYPDGIATVVMDLYTSRPHYWHEWDEQIVAMGPGQRPDSVVRKVPVMTLVDSNGTAVNYDWNPNPPKPHYPGSIIQMIHFTGKYSPFAAQKFTGGDIYSGERTWYSVFPCWNHWPVAQINSSGRNASFPDRASHCSISHLFWAYRVRKSGKIPLEQKLLMEGMSDLPAAALKPLVQSWLDPPPVSDVSGGTSRGYSKPHRAYGFTFAGAPLKFDISASKSRPIHNLCFEIKNWESASAKAALKINGVPQVKGPDFRQGITIDSHGKYELIVWLRLSSSSRQRSELTRY